MSSIPVVQRTVFSTSRTAEFLDWRALQSQTGQPRARFGDVVIKELLDNALDAAESARVRPEIGFEVSWADGVARVRVTDNGPGMPVGVVERILDFTRNVSDKESLRSPTRGMQGNAFKTLLGIPYALGVTEPVVIEALGVRHEIAVSADPSGDVATRHTQVNSRRTIGTSVTVPLPADLVTAKKAADWLQKFALVNPHARFVDHGQTGRAAGAGIYEPTAQPGWRKPLPTDPTSAHHYDDAAMAKLVFAHIREHQQGGADLTVRAFTNMFAGLTGSAKAKKVAERVPGITHLSGFEERREQVAVLLAAMKEHSKPPTPAYLGQVHRDHYTHVLDQAFGVEETWFARKQLTDAAGIPWSIEVTVARTKDPGDVCFAVNYSATFGDPLAATRLAGDGFTSTGALSFLSLTDAAPWAGNQSLRAAVVHLVCPVPQFTDKGKTVLVVPPEVADACAKALTTATRALAKDKRSKNSAQRREERAAMREANAAAKAAPKVSKKAAVFEVMREAIGQARGAEGLPFSSHTLFYKIRPLALKLLPVGAKLNAQYVEQNLIPDWERQNGPVQGLYREPRGTLHHPHDPDGIRDVRLGTREVREYIPPKWSYNKILVIEKTGLWPPVRESGIAEKYDMAVITNEGYGTEACRDLLASMPPGDVQIFVLHDADPYGYNIARTLGEETARMPDHRVEVIDLGLTVDDAIAKGLEAEPDTRDAALPAGILPGLTDTARDWFTGTPFAWNSKGEPTKWHYRRVELNAFSSPELIAYIEEGLARHHATGKVIPPNGELWSTAHQRLQHRVVAALGEAIDAMFPIDRLVQTVYADLDTDQITAIGPADLAQHHADYPTLSWEDAVTTVVDNRLRDHPRLADIARQAVAEYQDTDSR
ncbi:ATP-binding protein [Kitasatospora aureofaciens]|uniref:ATP-binding protein n=1 Tax=Kitasatospora aureofaciens TaxID=1894 RepID=UPI0006903BD7|nr:ATP-binding protein [Kitasatospora aureofaciens]